MGKGDSEAAPAPSTRHLEIRMSGLVCGEGRRSHWPSPYAAAALARLCNRLNPRHCEEPLRRSNPGAAARGASQVAPHTVSYNPVGVRQSAVRNFHTPRALRLHDGQRPQRHALHRRHVESGAAHPPTPRGPRGEFHAPLSAPAAGCSTRPVNACMKRSCAKSRSRAARAPRKMALIEAMNPQWRDLFADFA
jgi:hypothetical protein